jgi:hypothetical protein
LGCRGWAGTVDGVLIISFSVTLGFLGDLSGTAGSLIGVRGLAIFSSAFSFVPLPTASGKDVVSFGGGVGLL